jgi:hypothetical protein
MEVRTGESVDERSTLTAMRDQCRNVSACPSGATTEGRRKIPRKGRDGTCEGMEGGELLL